MAKQLTFISVPATSLPYPLAICAACALFVGALVPEAHAVESDAIAALPAAPAKITVRSLAPVKSAISRPTAKALPVKTGAINRTTVLTTSGGSRVVRRRAGSLRQITPEKNAARYALTAPGELPEITMAALATAPAAPIRLAEAPRDENTKATTQNLDLTDATPVTATVEVPEAPATVQPVADQAPAPPQDTTPPVEVPAATTPPAKTTGKPGEAAPPQPAKLYATRVSYEGNLIIAEGTPEIPVRLESGESRIIAQKVILDTQNHTVKAGGKVHVERQVMVERFNANQPKGIVAKTTSKEKITETLEGEDFEYNFVSKQGKLDKTSIRLENFNVTADQIIINGARYVAKNVVIRPGGLSPEEIKIYGTPPFSLRTPELTIDRSKLVDNSNKIVGDTENADEPSTTVYRTHVKSAALYFKNLRLIPVPSALLGRTLGRREEETFQITPRIYFNSADGVLVTTQMQYPLSPKRPGRLDLNADLGVSTKVGFRGGMELRSSTGIGRFAIGARINDVVSSQLTDRIELDRLPEIQYRPPDLALFNLPGGRKAGFRFGFMAGDYRESFTNQSRVVEDTRLQAQIRFTTRLANEQGFYLDLTSRLARYGDHPDNLTTAGFEVGYTGHLGSRINGQFSLGMQNVSGSTPFRFDKVEIKKELRTTFDVMLTPRYIIPIDIRYDLDTHTIRDRSFGLLRNYKTFAYGLVYQESRKELRLELRQGF